MKKIMMIFAALGLLMACSGNSEKKAEAAAEKTEGVSYMEQLANAADEQEGLEIAVKMGMWINSLSEKEEVVEKKAVEDWMKNNPASAIKAQKTLQKVQKEYGDILE